LILIELGLWSLAVGLWLLDFGSGIGGLVFGLWFCALGIGSWYLVLLINMCNLDLANRDYCSHAKD
jgi:hypothetical protein